MVNYEVLYIDKFVDPNRSRDVIGSALFLTSLPAKTQLRLVSGRPAIVKQYVDQVTAEDIKCEIINAGGTCWIQEQSTEGVYIDRRCNKRRYTENRRKAPRSEAFQSDRRQGQARRKNVLL